MQMSINGMLTKYTERNLVYDAKKYGLPAE